MNKKEEEKFVIQMSNLEDLIIKFDMLNNYSFFETKVSPCSHFELIKRIDELRYILKFMKGNYEKFKNGHFIP